MGTRFSSSREAVALAIRARPRLNLALLAAGGIAAALLLQAMPATKTGTTNIETPSSAIAGSPGWVHIPNWTPSIAVEQAVQDAVRLAPALESFVTQPESWWASLRDEAELIPSKILRKVAVGPGDTLMQLLTDAGAEPQDSHQAIQALGQKFNPRKLKIGQEITLTFERLDESGDNYRLFEMALAPSVEREVNVVRNDAGFRASETIREFNISHARVTGEITDSLYNAGVEAGLNSSLLAEFIKLFSFDVDFQREIQPGDSFEVFFERHLDEQGRAVKTGRIAAASLTLSGRELRYYYYRPNDGGDADYFTPRGQSVKKALLRTPIDGARLTSGFGKRMHPILGFSLMHKGVDFGAVSGTPIQAAGEGLVEVAGWNGGYGNYVRLRHGNGYATAYAHMTRINVKAGQRVRQGQIIGTVGSTGRSTGPHLHYEVLLQGKQVNPMNVRFPSGRKLEGSEYERFRRQVERIDGEMRGTPLLALLNRD